MGCCLSKTNPSHPPLSNVEPEIPQLDAESKIPPTQLEEISKIFDIAETEKKDEQQILEQEEKKEILVVKEKEEFVIQPRKSHDKRSDSKGLRSDPSEPESNNQKSLASNIMAMAANGGAVRTSSCTKEEVDAILIQCGRLSRSSSGKCASSGSNRKYSGSKRSHDFDKEINNNSNSVPIELNCDENEIDERQRRRQSRGSRGRTTPSRSRERDPHTQKSTGRRLSRSPAKRSETSNNTTTTTTSTSNRPGKLVSVPATVSSLSMEKSNNGERANTTTTTTDTGNVKRVLVRRNVTPPRSRSPARSALVGSSSNGVKNASNQNQPSPSRNLSRKAEHSPYRRTPLTDLDMNSLPFQPLGNKSSSIKGNQKIIELNGEVSAKQQPLTSVSQTKLGVVQGTHRRARSRGGEEGNDLATEAVSGSNTLTRTRSSRRSRDLDVDSLSNPNPTTNYTSLLLQDIQNFHQKASTTSTNTSAPPFKLPECVSKACSIVEAVADLNLNSCSTRPIGRVNVGDDDLMEPSLHKFVTVEKKREIDEKEESSGSNSVVVGGQNHWVSSSVSSWEHESEGVSPASFQRLTTVTSNSRSGVARSRAGNGR